MLNMSMIKVPGCVCGSSVKCLLFRTPFHADVFRSYSWSANICGRKKWLLYPPGQEENLRDCHGNLVYDVTAPLLQEKKLYPHYHEACQPLEIIQEAGEIIFVPSGWHHQVYNLVRIDVPLCFPGLEAQLI